MIRTRLGATAALACALALPLAACGGNEDNEFTEDYNAAVKPLNELSQDIGNSIGGAAGKSNDTIAKEFDKLADTAQETRTNLADLDPPEDAKESFDKLLDALKEGTDDLRAVAQAAKDADPAAAREASQDLVASGEQIRQAESELKKEING